MFGKGIYVTDCSLSKSDLEGRMIPLLMILDAEANYFASNINHQTDLHIMLLVWYVPGKVQHVRQPCQGRTAPDPGYDSVRIKSVYS